MRLLIGGAKTKFVLLKEFCEVLSKLDIVYKLVDDIEIYDTFPSIHAKNWLGTRRKFRKLIRDFKPDVVFVDRPSHFAIASEDERIPVFMLLRGDFWSEFHWNRKTHKSPIWHLFYWQWNKMSEKCYQNSTVILPMCKYLENIVKERYPNKTTEVLYGGIKTERWNAEDGMDLKHPCVGLLQNANLWGKTREMLTLTKVIESMRNVTFYWAGDGIYRDQILSKLNKYENFKWLGPLQYPDAVRKYLTAIDIFALPTGLDMAPSSLLEAQLMQKPVIATNVGGIPEIMQNERTGFLVNSGDYNGWIEKISILLNDKEKATKMGLEGCNFIKNNFDWNDITKRFVDILNSHFNKNA